MDSSKTVYITSSLAFNYDFAQWKFMNTFLYLLVLSRLNTTNCFELVDASQQILQNSHLLLNFCAWLELPKIYSGPLRIQLSMIVFFKAQLGCKIYNGFNISKSLASTWVSTEIIHKKQVENFQDDQVREVLHSILPFISSPSGLLSKHNGGWKNIY